MKCPYCDREMILGDLRSGNGKAVYWMPTSAERDFSLLTCKNIEGRKGIVLDHITRIGFIAKERPTAYYCEACKIILTKL